MNKVKYKLKGHESFIIREGWLTKGITVAEKDSKVFSVNSGADALGVGTNMAKSIRYWLRAAKLTTENTIKGVQLTDIGRCIYENDIYFEDTFSLWITHINIASNFELATSWNLFFNHMILTSAFSRDEMVNIMRSLIIEHTGEQEPSERSIRDDCSAILSMYSRSDVNDDPEEKKNSPFEELGMLENTGNKYTKKRPMVDKIDPLVILYVIIKRLNDEKSLHIDSLIEDENMPGKILNINRIIINDFLDILQNKGYIIVNRTAGLDIIYPEKCRDMTREDIVKEYFKRSKKS